MKQPEQKAIRFGQDVAIEATTALRKLKEISGGDDKKLYDFTRKIIDGAFSSEKIQNSVSCNNSCSFCCHDKIIMSKTEAEIVKEKIVKNNSFFDIERANLQKYEEAGTKKITFQEKACPALLDPDEKGNRKCGIYNFRPIVCIQHNSTEDFNNCNKEGEDGYKVEKTITEVFVRELDVLNMMLLVNEYEKPENTSSDDCIIAMHNLF
jgi:Fe-S-cluster containining protein